MNISRIGHTSLFNTTDGDGGFFSNLVNDLEGDINSLISDVSSDIANALDLPDFYNVHVMAFCEGSYEPNTTARHAHENVTECSNKTLSFHFQPSKIIQDHLPDGITLNDIHWPKEIEDAERTLQVASIVMVVFYIIGITFAGLAVLAALGGFFTNGRLSAMINFLIDVVSGVSKRLLEGI